MARKIIHIVSALEPMRWLNLGKLVKNNWLKTTDRKQLVAKTMKKTCRKATRQLRLKTCQRHIKSRQQNFTNFVIQLNYKLYYHTIN